MLNGHGPASKVVVVGGSLGGLFNAIALRSLGYEVDVYEKSSGLMQDRGAGIVLQGDVNAAPGDELDRVLIDKDGRRREFSVPQGIVSPGMADWLHGQARRILPPTFLRLVEATREPFVQTIHDLAVPKMAFGRVCLSGDAAFVPRPHTAASTAKAAANALALTNCLAVAKGDVVAALRRWEPAQLDYGEQLRVHGQRLGKRSQFN